MKNYRNVTGVVIGRPWALMPEKLEEIRAVLAMRLRGEETHWDGPRQPEFETRYFVMDDDANGVRIREIDAASPSFMEDSTGGAVAVLPLFGVMMQRVSGLAEMSGATSTEKFKTEFRKLVNNAAVKSIIIDVDSPGGSVYGTDELASEIRAAASKKTVVAVADSLMASAAYYASSGASEIVASPSSEVGSIGVLAVHYDYSEQAAMEGVKPTLIKAGKFKAEGHPDFPLGDEAEQHIQEEVDRYYGMFLKAVSAGRGVSVERVRSGFGEGRVFGAQEALRAGMVDRVATLDETIARFAGGGRPSKKVGAELSQEDADAVRAEAEEKYGGPDGAHVPVKLEDDPDKALVRDRLRVDEARTLTTR
jgi:signal peptide peptidase SppA